MDRKARNGAAICQQHVLALMTKNNCAGHKEKERARPPHHPGSPTTAILVIGDDATYAAGPCGRVVRGVKGE